MKRSASQSGMQSGNLLGVFADDIKLRTRIRRDDLYYLGGPGIVRRTQKWEKEVQEVRAMQCEDSTPHCEDEGRSQVTSTS